jgi:hypothetical protein
MTIKELLFQEIESTPEELLKETLDFLQFLKTKQIKSQTEIESDQIPTNPFALQGDRS